MRRIKCPVCQRQQVPYQKWQRKYVLARHTVNEKSTQVCMAGSGLVIVPAGVPEKRRGVRL